MLRASKLKSLPRILEESACTRGRERRLFDLLLTAISLAQRRGFWQGLDQLIWVLPAARNITKQDLVRPLTKQALEITPQRAGEFVFLYRWRQHGDRRIFKN
jgi:hypothetical protein